MRDVGAGYETFGAIDDVMVAIAHGCRAHGARIRAGVGFGLRKAALALAAHGRHQVALAHLALKRIERRADVRAETEHTPTRQRDRAAELRPDDRAAQRAETLPTQFLRHVDLPEAQL